ncbi:hypothetical protein [Leisingera sp. McT4-56]|uniref:hypothetical protein n=1 Tax=Leisingera sp. McT4-56 TaxID=2881255 RepID=UPI001CF8094C|nr:hypothetical protein [Leisingera sp. McT4-56]MCB4458543.1 hypothetical protein [Leisingera sp. McT4-56]
MADICRIMRMGTEKGLWPANEADDGSTFITRTFDTLTKAVDEALELERDLSHALSWDPASTDIQEAVEAKWQDCLKLSGDILTAPVVSAEDLPMQRMSMLLHFLIESESLDEALRFQQLMHEHRDLFTTDDPGVREALNRAARQVDAVAEMAVTAPEFAPV